MRLKESAATRTVLLRQDVERSLRLQRRDVDDRPLFNPSMLQETATLRTSIAYLGRYGNNMVCLGFVKASATMARMTFLRTPSLELLLGGSIGFERNLRGRRGRAERTLLFLTLQIP
jgi:hypothetical protein